VVAIVQADAGELVMVTEHFGHRPGQDGNSALGQVLALVRSGWRGASQHGQVRTEQPEHHGLVDGHGSGCEHTDALVAHFVAVAEGAVPTSLPHSGARTGTSGSSSRPPVATMIRLAPIRWLSSCSVNARAAVN
jgi:hypothetical protein